MYKRQAYDSLAQLARIRALRSEKESPRQLLRERGGAFLVAVQVEEIVSKCAEDAPEINPAVLKEPPVFDGDDGLNQVGWNLVVIEQPALGAICVFAQAGDEQRLELVAGERLSMICLLYTSRCV